MPKSIRRPQNYGSPIIFLMHQIAQTSRKEVLLGFKEQGVDLTPEQWSLLIELWKEDGLSPSKLAALTCRDRPSTSRLIESLKKRGLIKRMYNEEDRRAYSVYLTEDGKQCHKTLLPIYNEVITQSLEGMDQTEQKELVRLLKHVYKNLISI